MNSVRRSKFAQNDLADLWFRATSEQRGRITSDIAELERNLGMAPESVGESRDRDRRIAFLRDVTVDFLWMPDDLLVVVVAVRKRPSRNVP